MPISERAKQFMPFAALKGFEEAIRQKEREYFKEERAQLSEEKTEEISEVLSALGPDDMICVEYYDGYNYTEECACVHFTDTREGFISTDKGSIYFNDIKNVYKL